ncbi:STAS domain-containing protein [Saccharothrix sp. NRRL B-16348]|uniref:STAS domain-containing protein n=1 Tax=Saccharothrix sp. NRRL B-16348 TaxID=1415542 RepID=UPI001E47C45D|nr:STAS domain-containing protein [Saccharothrix sp. NRRL B-16348]
MTTSTAGWREGIGMLALSVEAHRTGCAVVVATGELDLAGARRVLDRMDRLVSEGRDRIVLDMSGVAFCGAQAMSALVRTRARAQRAGGWLRLAAVPPHVRRVFERTDLDRLFPRYPDVASAASGRVAASEVVAASGEERGAASGRPVGGAASGRPVGGAVGGAVSGRPVGGRAVGDAVIGDGVVGAGAVSDGSAGDGAGGDPADGRRRRVSRAVSSGDRGVVEREPPSQAR